MAQYIDKSALVAEIEKRLKTHADLSESCGITSYGIRANEDNDILCLLDTLEVKEFDF